MRVLECLHVESNHVKLSRGLGHGLGDCKAYLFLERFWHPIGTNQPYVALCNNYFGGIYCIVGCSRCLWCINGWNTWIYSISSSNLKWSQSHQYQCKLTWDIIIMILIDTCCLYSLQHCTSYFIYISIYQSLYNQHALKGLLFQESPGRLNHLPMARIQHLSTPTHLTSGP